MYSINRSQPISTTAHPDTRKGPIPGKPGTFKTPAGGSKRPGEQQVLQLLKSFEDAAKLPDANRPDSLFAPGRSKRESLLVAFCRSVNAKAHAFLIQVLVPVIDQLAQRIDAAGPDESGAVKDWKRTVGKHLIVGADAALQARNPRSLNALLDVSLKHFPNDVPEYIASRLERDPRSIETFLAAGLDREALETMLAARAGAPMPPAASAAPSGEPAPVAPPPPAVAPPASAAASIAATPAASAAARTGQVGQVGQAAKA
jgi:hypothetical protein